MRADRYRAQESLEGGVTRELERGPVRTYKGVIARRTGAQARLTIDKETFEGLIITPGQIYFLSRQSVIPRLLALAISSSINSLTCYKHRLENVVLLPSRKR